MTKKEEVQELSVELKGISDWLYATEKDIMGDIMSKSAEHLDSYAYSLCAGGFVCDGGDDCTSDHK